MVLAELPRRDAPARAHLNRVARQARPGVLARDRAIALSGSLQPIVPGGALVRGSVLRVEGAPGAGSTSLVFELVAAVTGLGEWAAMVDDGTVGARAAADAGVVLERFAVVRRVPPSRWATVVAALLDGTSLVVADVPRGVSFADARRLTARVRERSAVLAVHELHVGAWPADVLYTVSAEGSAWTPPDAMGMLTGRRLHARVEGRGSASRARRSELARVG